MDWIDRTLEKRLDPKNILESVQSIIMLGVNYYTDNTNPVPPGHGRISRYARGRDYHNVIEKKLRHLIVKLKEQVESSASEDFYFYVDYGPFMERAYAQKAGLGFIGKNSMLINDKYGSWFFLGEILTSVSLEPERESQPDEETFSECGDCTLCIDSCPTGAIVDPGIVDSRRCLSSLTVESDGEISDDYTAGMDINVFGCDVCQEVCPFNAKSVITSHKDFLPVSGVGEFLDLKKVLALDDQEAFIELTAGTALKRPGSMGLKRNARIVLENIKRKR